MIQAGLSQRQEEISIGQQQVLGVFQSGYQERMSYAPYVVQFNRGCSGAIAPRLKGENLVRFQDSDLFQRIESHTAELSKGRATQLLGMI